MAACNLKITKGEKVGQPEAGTWPPEGEESQGKALRWEQGWTERPGDDPGHCFSQTPLIRMGDQTMGTEEDPFPS